MAVEVMLVPAALGDTTPVYLRTMEDMAGMGLRVMPLMSLGIMVWGFDLSGVPKDTMSTPRDRVTCRHSTGSARLLPSLCWEQRSVRSHTALETLPCAKQGHKAGYWRGYETACEEDA